MTNKHLSNDYQPYVNNKEVNNIELVEYNVKAETGKNIIISGKIQIISDFTREGGKFHEVLNIYPTLDHSKYPTFDLGLQYLKEPKTTLIFKNVTVTKVARIAKFPEWHDCELTFEAESVELKDNPLIYSTPSGLHNLTVDSSGRVSYCIGPRIDTPYTYNLLVGNTEWTVPESKSTRIEGYLVHFSKTPPNDFQKAVVALAKDHWNRPQTPYENYLSVTNMYNEFRTLKINSYRRSGKTRSIPFIIDELNPSKCLVLVSCTLAREALMEILKDYDNVSVKLINYSKDRPLSVPPCGLLPIDLLILDECDYTPTIREATERTLKSIYEYGLPRLTIKLGTSHD